MVKFSFLKLIFFFLVKLSRTATVKIEIKTATTCYTSREKHAYDAKDRNEAVKHFEAKAHLKY